MTTYGERLEEALNLAKRSRNELSEEIGVSVQAIGQVIAGKTKALTAENSARTAKYLMVDHFWLATGEGSPRSASQRPFDWLSEDLPFDELLPEQKRELGRIVAAFMAGAGTANHKKRA